MICDRLGWWRNGENPYFIAEFNHSILVVCDLQYHRGYTLILLKEHLRELHELPLNVQEGLFREMMVATNAVVKTYHPDKMNHLCLGNAEPHIHWHIIPRYVSDPFYHQQPFAPAAEFDNYRIDAEMARKMADEIRANLT